MRLFGISINKKWRLPHAAVCKLINEIAEFFVEFRVKYLIMNYPAASCKVVHFRHRIKIRKNSKKLLTNSMTLNKNLYHIKI